MSAVSAAHFECFVPRKLLCHTTASLVFAHNTLQATGIFILPKLFCLHCPNVTPLQCTYGEVYQVRTPCVYGTSGHKADA